MSFDKLRFISAAIVSIVLSIEMTILYIIHKNEVLSITQLIITGCIVYICSIVNTLKTN